MTAVGSSGIVAVPEQRHSQGTKSDQWQDISKKAKHSTNRLQQYKWVFQ
jgi:hypothetical protein